MKQMIIGAVLCGAALAWAAAANAESYTFDNRQFLDGSTDALVLGPTGIPTPPASYISSGMDLYLNPLGYEGTTDSTLALTLPNTFNFLRSVPEGQSILVNQILADYHAGDMGCDATGVCSDPLTIFTYSQSSLVAALSEQQLMDAGVPTDALRFVMLGANAASVPTNLYPTEIFNINGDVFVADVTKSWLDLLLGGTNWEQLLFGLGLHSAYLGLTADQIDSATTVVDGMTTINEIPTLSTDELFQALFNVWFGG